MSVKQIPNLPVAIALSGAEQLEAVQAGVSVRMNVAQLIGAGLPQAREQARRVVGELIPVGFIMLWNVASGGIPEDWARCDGQPHPRSDGSGDIVTPYMLPPTHTTVYIMHI